MPDRAARPGWLQLDRHGAEPARWRSVATAAAASPRGQSLLDELLLLSELLKSEALLYELPLSELL